MAIECYLPLFIGPGKYLCSFPADTFSRDATQITEEELGGQLLYVWFATSSTGSHSCVSYLTSRVTHVKKTLLVVIGSFQKQFQDRECVTNACLVFIPITPQTQNWLPISNEKKTAFLLPFATWLYSTGRNHFGIAQVLQYFQVW